MDRNRKILISILAVLVLSAVIAIVDISLKIQDKEKIAYTIKAPRFGPGVGIVRIEGAISMSNSRSFGIASGTDLIINRLDELEKDHKIKAVVVRINSPGGTVAAVQEIYQKIWRLRKKNIPLVASMGDISASGGYYVASACNYIIANHGTITGSIGVIAFSPNLKRLFDKLGIRMNVIKSGKHKDIFASYRDLSNEEKNLIQQMIDSSYKKFLKDIALGRNQNQSDIEPYADGRVMNGETALSCKLIDGIGTFEDAIDKAREMADLPKDSPVYHEYKTPIQQFLMSLETIYKVSNTLEKKMNFNNIYRLEYRYIQ